jgi:hypothetical protein
LNKPTRMLRLVQNAGVHARGLGGIDRFQQVLRKAPWVKLSI